jgi:hypothetical protein
VLKKDPNDEKSDYVISGSNQDLKVTKSPKMNVVDKEKFLQKIKDL